MGIEKTFIVGFIEQTKIIYTQHAQKFFKQIYRKMFINVSNRKTSDHQNVLSVLSDKMKSPEVMTFSDFNKSFLIHNEVSELGLGAVLY